METVNKELETTTEVMEATKTKKPAPKYISPEDREREQDMRLVKGIFKCYMPLGGSIKFSKRKYKGESIKTYEMHDGFEYTVPYYVAKQIAEDAWYPRNERYQGENGQSIKIGSKVKVADFITTGDFVDVKPASNIVTVTKG